MSQSSMLVIALRRLTCVYLFMGDPGYRKGKREIREKWGRGLVMLYGISTFMGYLMPNLVYKYLLDK